MDTNDFLGSFAQENVTFTTRVVRTSTVGDTYWKVMIFVENDRFVDSTASDWSAVPGSSSLKALAVTADDYAGYTTGVLQSWLYDLFCSGFTGDCILVACTSSGAPDSSAFISSMETAYELLKAYAYHKTVCAAPTLSKDATFVLDTDVAVSLAKLCAGDKNLLSSAPYFPFTTSSPEDASTDVLYSALKAASTDAFMTAYQDSTRNGALFSLGLAMSTYNSSGTCVGNALDMVATSMINCSGKDGANLSKGIRSSLSSLNIQTFKPVGDNSGNVAAVGASTINGEVVSANWILAYIAFMVKVRIAQMLTSGNFLRNEANYTTILNVMASMIQLFGSNGSGRLSNVVITAPAFGSLPSSGDEIVIDNAWSATYVDQVRSVTITGTLYIGV